MKLFQPNSFGEVCLLEESYEDMQKVQIFGGGGGGHVCLNLNFRQIFPSVYTWFYNYR